jgi:hypothetical protein
MTILFDILLRVARELTPDVYESSATGGSASTLADTTNPEASDFWNNGTLFFKSGLMADRSAVITDFTITTGLFAFSPVNRVTNFGFETNTSGYAASGAGVSIARVTSEYHRGVASCEVTTASNVHSEVGYALSCESGIQFTFSVEVKDIAAQDFSLFVTDPDSNVVSASTVLWTGTGAWVRKSLTITPTTAGTHTFYVQRDAVASTTKYYIDDVQIVVGTEALYLECAQYDEYLSLTPAWSRSRLIQAVNTALGKQDITADNTATSSVAAQYTYNLPTDVSRILSIFVGTEVDGWVRHFNWKEEGVHLRFTANEPDADTILIRYLTKHGTVAADSATIDIGINVDLLVKDALAELWFQRWGGVDRSEAAKIRYQTYAGEAERLRSRLPHHNPDPRYSGL